MNDKEISELRRRFRPDRSSITHVRGCYVNDNQEIISCFDQSLALSTQEETEQYMALLKRALSGALGRNLIDVTFSTQQVLDSDEHRLLSALRGSALQDEAALQTFFEKVAASLSMETNYVILLAHDVYDVPYRARDGASLEDASETQFSYIVCSICPVKPTKPALSYDTAESLLHNRKADWVVAAPELGFLFPAFDSRSTNLYNALFYTRNSAESHDAFVDAVFHTEPPMPADAQKQTFQSLLSETLEEDCSYDVVQTVHEQLHALIEAHKESRDPEPLVITKHQVESVLQSCGVSGEGVQAFDQQFDKDFGADAVLSPRNLVDARLEVSTPDVTIRVNPERRDLVETRVIGGAKYILIRADESVEVNGVNIHIAD